MNLRRIVSHFEEILIRNLEKKRLRRKDHALWQEVMSGVWQKSNQRKEDA